MEPSLPAALSLVGLHLIAPPIPAPHGSACSHLLGIHSAEIGKGLLARCFFQRLLAVGNLFCTGRAS